MALKPNSDSYYKMGRDVAEHLDPELSFEEISAKLGETRQKVHKDCMIALGKLAYRLKKYL